VDFADLLSPDRIVLDLRVRDKAQLLTELGRRAEAMGVGVPAARVADALRSREQLGSTGLGGGFALPHASIACLSARFGMFVRLARPLDFDAIDGQPVDLAFLLLTPVTPGSGHVAALAAVSRALRVRERLRRLRAAPDVHAALAALTADLDATSSGTCGADWRMVAAWEDRRRAGMLSFPTILY